MFCSRRVSGLQVVVDLYPGNVWAEVIVVHQTFHMDCSTIRSLHAWGKQDGAATLTARPESLHTCQERGYALKVLGPKPSQGAQCPSRNIP